jgi:ribonucleotide reductase beta subunit family protein with ferritin-like domain
MAYKGLFNTEKSDYTKNPLFLGEDLGLHDSVNIQYPELEALYRQAVAQNWSDKEFDFSRDAKQFAENSTEAQMMIDTIATQWEMDSVASRSMLSLLAPFITNTELYELVAFNSYIECLTPEHEVFKKGEGWVQIPNIRVGDAVLQFNPETETLEFVEVSDTIEKEYKDDIVVFNGEGFHQRVTKGHRMVGHSKEGTIVIKEAKDMEYSELDGFVVECCKEVNSSFKYVSDITKEYVPYDGKVYCITVPSGAFLVRHDNRISVTGNCVHSGTYSEIVRNAFPDPKAVIDDILSKEDAMTRATLIGQVMEELYVVGHKFALGQLTKEEVFPVLYKGIVALFLLERGQFVASFAITFALGEAGMFQECAAAIRKVCADEVQIHASADVVMLRELRKMGFWEDYKDNKDFQSSINAFVEEVYQGELLWTEQLFKDRGSLCGLSCQDIKDWVTFNFQIIRQELDLPVEITIKENPLPYMEKWMSLNALQQANQETTSLAYLLDATKDDSAEAELDF